MEIGNAADGHAPELDFVIAKDNKSTHYQIKYRVLTAETIPDYLFEKLTNVLAIRLDTIDVMMVKIKNKNFRDVLNQHGKFLTTLFASKNTDSGKFLEKLSKISEYYKTMSKKLEHATLARPSNAGEGHVR